MSIYPRFLIKDADRFVAFEFPKLEASIEKVTELLKAAPDGPKDEMILAFVKDHSIPAPYAEKHPELAQLISSGSLPLEIVKDLFASSKKNPEFTSGLEAYIRSCFPQNGK